MEGKKKEGREGKQKEGREGKKEGRQGGGWRSGPRGD